VTTAAERWAQQLAAWAIPDEILEAAPESPYGFPTELFRRRGLHTQFAATTPTTLRARQALPDEGTVLDVGVGGGGTSLPLADRASLIVGIDASESMLDAFREAAAASSVKAECIKGTWPIVAPDVEPQDVVVCGHVLYNAQAIHEFGSALDDHARIRVVVELTERHPWAWMNDLWMRLHGLRRPSGPSADDAGGALQEIGIQARREDHSMTRHEGFERREDAVALVRRRLCLPASRDAEVEAALGERLSSDDGLWSAGPSEQHLVTLWWDVAR